VKGPPWQLIQGTDFADALLMLQATRLEEAVDGFLLLRAGLATPCSAAHFNSPERSGPVDRRPPHDARGAGSRIDPRAPEGIEESLNGRHRSCRNIIRDAFPSHNISASQRVEIILAQRRGPEIAGGLHQFRTVLKHMGVETAHIVRSLKERFELVARLGKTSLYGAEPCWSRSSTNIDKDLRAASSNSCGVQVVGKSMEIPSDIPVGRRRNQQVFHLTRLELLESALIKATVSNECVCRLV